MSNEMHVVRTRFESLDETGAVCSTKYGARIYGDIGNAYVNFLDSLEDLLAMDAQELLYHIASHSETGAEMLALAKEGLTSLYIDGELLER